MENKHKNITLITFAKRIILLSLALIVLLPFGARGVVPQISNLELTSITNSSIIITWQTSNAAASSGIIYGISSSNDNSYTDPATDPDSGGTYVNNHHLILENLSPGITYYYKIKTANADGTTYSSEKTFTTLAQPSGDYLFTFAILSDIKYARGRSDDAGARGRPYSHCQNTLGSAVAEVNAHSPDFTIILGDMLEADFSGVASQVSSDLLPTLATLEGQGVTGDSLEYFVLPGEHDKLIDYTGNGDDWITGSTGALNNYRYSYSTSDATTSSVYNYSFNYKGYHFVMLDTAVGGGSASGEANTTWLGSDLSANSTKKTFIFSHFPAYDITEDIPEGAVIPDEEIGAIRAASNISNIAAFNNTIEAYAANIPAIFAGHTHDNFRSTRTHGSNQITHTRIASLSQFPIGYAIIKVYSNGFTQTFYKVRANDISETARAQITDAMSTPAAVWQQTWLGATSARNYTQTYSTITTGNPSVTITSPTAESVNNGQINVTGIATGETNLAKIELYVDSSLFTSIEASGSSQTFSIPLNTISLSNASHTVEAIAYDIVNSSGEASVTIQTSNTVPITRLISPNGGETLTGLSSHEIQWSVSGDLASSPISLYYSTNGGSSYPNTIATGLSNGGTYTWTVPDISSSTVKVKIVAQGLVATNIGSDESNANLTINYADNEGPETYIIPLLNDITENGRPTFTGIATDENRTVASVECNIDSGTWYAASPLDGTFNSSSEGFYWRVPETLSVGYHNLYARAYDSNGNVGSQEVYSHFYLTREKPSLIISVESRTVYSGDYISATPTIEGRLISAVGIDTGSIAITLDSTQEITTGITTQAVNAPYSYDISYQFTSALSIGTHDISIRATDVEDRVGTWEVVSLRVAGADAAPIPEQILNYPNPFSPSLTSNPATGGTYISYTLSSDSNTKIAVFDLMGTKLREINCTAGGTGGSVGYNEVYFNGLTTNGTALGNGIYIYLIIIDGKAEGKGKLTVIQ